MSLQVKDRLGMLLNLVNTDPMSREKRPRQSKLFHRQAQQRRQVEDSACPWPRYRGKR